MQWLTCGGRAVFVNLAGLGIRRGHYPARIGLAMRTASQDKTPLYSLQKTLQAELHSTSKALLRNQVSVCQNMHHSRHPF